jgi:choline dehydrogenase-like flavoprotein
MNVSYMPRAVAAGARLRTGVEARRVLVEEGRAAGVRCRVGAEDGRPHTVRARRATIVAGGALGTPELLLASGLGGPQVGRNLHIHPACWVGARYEEEVRGWEGVMQSYYVDEWEAEGLLLEATFTPLPFGGAWLLGSGREHQQAILDFQRIGSIGVHLSDRSGGRVGLGANGSTRVTYRLTSADARRLTFGIARAAEIHFAAGATEVYPNIARAPVLRPGDLASFEATVFKPAELRLEAFHPMGTARMASDPAAGVCDVDGSVRGANDLYVADASLFPTSVGVNPMMTIIGFAKRVAAGIASAAPAASAVP